MFGLTTREWYLFGIGSAVQGALVGAVLHSLPLIALNLVCLAFGLYMLPNSGTEE